MASDIVSKSATAVIDALIGGERRGQVLADLSQALAGRFTEHHALLCGLHRDRITGFDTAVGGLDERIAGRAARWQRQIDLLTTEPGFGDVVACAWLGEIGPTPHRYFPGHDKLEQRHQPPQTAPAVT